MDTLARGVAIGFAVAVPVGPIGLLCIHRTLRFGLGIGFASGAGAALADTVYAVLAGLALSFVTSLFGTIGHPLHLAGGVAIALAGIRTLLVQHARDGDAELARSSRVSAFVTTFVLTMVNPLTILSFAAFVSASSSALNASTAMTFAVGVGIGSLLWWLLLSTSVSLVRRRLGEAARRALDLLSGAVLLFFGLLTFFR